MILDNTYTIVINKSHDIYQIIQCTNSFKFFIEKNFSVKLELPFKLTQAKVLKFEELEQLTNFCEKIEFLNSDTPTADILHIRKENSSLEFNCLVIGYLFNNYMVVVFKILENNIFNQDKDLKLEKMYKDLYQNNGKSFSTRISLLENSVEKLITQDTKFEDIYNKVDTTSYKVDNIIKQLDTITLRSLLNKTTFQTMLLFVLSMLIFVVNVQNLSRDGKLNFLNIEYLIEKLI